MTFISLIDRIKMNLICLLWRNGCDEPPDCVIWLANVGCGAIDPLIVWVSICDPVTELVVAVDSALAIDLVRRSLPCSDSDCFDSEMSEFIHINLYDFSSLDEKKTLTFFGLCTCRRFRPIAFLFVSFWHFPNPYIQKTKIFWSNM